MSAIKKETKWARSEWRPSAICNQTFRPGLGPVEIPSLYMISIDVINDLENKSISAGCLLPWYILWSRIEIQNFNTFS